MEINMKLKAAGIILFIQFSCVVCYYPEYYVEDSCKFGNETIFYNTSEMGFAATLKATAEGPYKSNKNCKIVIQGPSDRGIVLSIRKIDFRRSLRYDCEDYIKVYYSDAFESPTTICHFTFDLEERLSFFKKGPMTILYHTELKEDPKYNVEQGFTLTYTSVYLDIQDCTNDNVFMCGDGRCISKDLTCDGRNNCGNRNDESAMFCDGHSLYFLKMLDNMYMLIFAILIFVIFFTGFIFIRYNRRRRTETELLTNLEESTVKPTPFAAISQPESAWTKKPSF